MNVLQKNDSAKRTWHCLAAITALRFVSKSANNTGWSGCGKGLVAVDLFNANTVIFTETGTWQADTGQQFDFNNVFRWSFDNSTDIIQLEHLRYGANNPVHLFDLTLINNFEWQSITPHLCCDDVYSAILSRVGNTIEMQWTIKGPKKNEYIHYWYS